MTDASNLTMTPIPSTEAMEKMLAAELCAVFAAMRLEAEAVEKHRWGTRRVEVAAGGWFRSHKDSGHVFTGRRAQVIREIESMHAAACRTLAKRAAETAEAEGRAYWLSRGIATGGFSPAEGVLA